MQHRIFLPWFCVGFVGVWLAVPAKAIDTNVVHQSEQPYWLSQDHACGLKCLTFLTAFYGKDHSYYDLSTLVPVHSDGSSLNDLKMSANELGLCAYGFSADIEEIFRLKYAAILHEKRDDAKGHFVVYLGWDKQTGQCRIYEPDQGYAKLTPEELQQRYSGYGLIVSQQGIKHLRHAFVPGFNGFSLLLTGVVTQLLLLLLVRQLGLFSQQQKTVAAAA